MKDYWSRWAVFGICVQEAKAGLADPALLPANLVGTIPIFASNALHLFRLQFVVPATLFWSQFRGWDIRWNSVGKCVSIGLRVLLMPLCHLGRSQICHKRLR